MKYEYEAVSGDQSLFDLVGANENDSVIMKMNGEAGSLIVSGRKPPLGWELLAERKVTEKYIPKAGDVFGIDWLGDGVLPNGELLCLKASGGKVCFEYLTIKVGSLDMTNDNLNFKFIRKHDDKAANPVNFTSEKYVPRVGDYIAFINQLGKPHCTLERVVSIDGDNMSTIEHSHTMYKRDYFGLSKCSYYPVLVHRPSAK